MSAMAGGPGGAAAVTRAFGSRLRRGAWLALLLLAGCSSCRTLPPYRVDLRDATRAYGFSRPHVDGDAVALRSPGRALAFDVGSSRFTLDGTTVYLNAPLARQGARLHLADQDVLAVLQPLLDPRAALARARLRRVVLDPGHGGEDTGALGRGGAVREKDLTLDMAWRVARLLGAQGVQVRLTREGDATLGLDARAAIANAWQADLFVSIHANAAPNGAASGVETFVVPAAGYPSTSGTASAAVHPGNAHDAASVILAYEVQRRLLERTRATDRGVRRARFSVIRNVNVPGILVEAGFLSNDAERARLEGAAYREAVAAAVAEGVLAWGRWAGPAAPQS